MPHGRPPASPGAPARADLGLCLALTLAVGAVSPWFAGIRSGNELSRVFLTEALLVDGTVSIDGAMARHGNVRDKSLFESKHYSDKAPGVSLLALPGVALYRALTTHPTLEGEVRAARWMAAVLPTLLLLWGLLGWVREITDRRTARALVILSALGSLGTTYGTLLFGHQLAGALVLWAYLHTRRLRAPPEAGSRCKPGRHALLAGFCAAAAVLVEYPSAVPLLPVGAAFAWWTRRRPALLLSALAGAALPLGVLLGYHTLAFGHPLHTGYQYIVNPFFAGLHDTGFLGVGRPRFGRLGFHLWSPRKGLWFFAPWLALALPGCWAWLRPGKRMPTVPSNTQRPEAHDSQSESHTSTDAPVVIAVVALWLLLLLGMAYDNGGWTLGQRHLTGLVPWLVWLVAVALRRWPALRPVLVGWGLVALVLTGIGTAIYPYYPEHARHPSVTYGLHFALAGVDGGGLWANLGLGSLWGAVTVAAAATLALLRWLRRPRAIVVALALAGTHLGLVFGLGPPRSPDARRDWLLPVVLGRPAPIAKTLDGEALNAEAPATADTASPPAP